MSSDQDSRGFLPPTITVFSDELHRQPPSSSATPTGNNPHHLSGPTTLPTSPTTPNTISNIISQESDLATAIAREIFKIRDAAADTTAAASAVDTYNPSRRKNQNHPTTTARRNTRRRTGTRTVGPSVSSRNTVSESLNCQESAQIKRLKKGEEVMVTEMEQRCLDLTRKSEGEDNPSEVTLVEHDKGKEESIGLKRVKEDEEESVKFKRLDDGTLRIQMCCSCRKHFEILHNHIGCFYRLM